MQDERPNRTVPQVDRTGNEDEGGSGNRRIAAALFLFTALGTLVPFRFGKSGNRLPDHIGRYGPEGEGRSIS